MPRLARFVRAAASDITPLRESAAFRRLFVGQTVSQIGAQVTQVAVPLQVYAITKSSLDVGLIGLASFVPLLVFGLYGGAIADEVDRRKLVILTSTATMLLSVVLLAQALAHLNQLWLLYLCVVVQSGFAAVGTPTRGAIVPFLVGRHRLPAANTLIYGSFQLAVILGPLIAGVAVGTGGFGAAYAIDVATFSAAFYAAVRLPRMPPEDTAHAAPLAAIREGFRFLSVRPVILMTFLVDINAMLTSSPRALFPALAVGHFGGGAHTAGLLYAAPGVGAILVTIVGGLISRVHRQGVGITVSIAVWALTITAFGLSSSLWFALLMLAVAGAADTVSAVYRSTMLQVATPNSMQGRLQGVYSVVVTGGTRLGDVRAGAMGSVMSPQVSLVAGGIACLVGLAALVARVPAFLRYDARRVLPPDHDAPVEALGQRD
jgi:MFS family permease